MTTKSGGVEEGFRTRGYPSLQCTLYFWIGPLPKHLTQTPHGGFNKSLEQATPPGGLLQIKVPFHL